MLEAPHLHITLITDDSFRLFFRRDSRLLKELLRVGAQAVQEVLSDLYPGMQIGLFFTVHTFGRDLGYKPHIHLVITKCGRYHHYNPTALFPQDGHVTPQLNYLTKHFQGGHLLLNRDLTNP
jgi:hypothetical protein